MAQHDFGVIDPGNTSGVELAQLLEQFRDGIHSSHSGNSRPAYAQAGMLWVKSVSGTLSEVYFFDGTNDVLLVSVNPATGAVIGAADFLRNAGNLNAGTLPHARLPKATQAQAEVGADSSTVMTPQRVAQAIAALTSSDAETLNGQGGAYYRNASNLNAGTVPAARLPQLTQGQAEDTASTVYGAVSGERLAQAVAVGLSGVGTPSITAGSTNVWGQAGPLTNGTASYLEVWSTGFIKNGGSVRVRLDLRRTATTATAYAKVLKNGVQVIEWSETSTTPVAHQIDVALAPGDKLSVEIKGGGSFPATLAEVTNIYLASTGDYPEFFTDYYQYRV